MPQILKTAKKMKLFRTVQKNFTSLGFVRYKNNDYNHYPFNRQHVKAQIRFILSLISMFAFPVHVANSPKEYMDSFFLIIMQCAIFVSYTVTICKMNQLFDFIDGCVELCNESKLMNPKI